MSEAALEDLTMDVRRLDMTQAAEATVALRVEATAFRYTEGYRRLLTEIDEAAGQLLPDPAAGDPARHVWGAFLDEQLVAVTTAIDYQMLFEGQPVPMIGIAGVATLPEHRRQGAVRAIMKHLLQEARQQGQVFSWLYPFSYAFYGKFGYGHGCRCYRVELPTNILQGLSATGTVKPYDQADKPAVRAVYDQFIAGSNGAVLRSDGNWTHRLDKDRWSEQFHTYLWQDESGQVGAWMSFKTLSSAGTDTLQIQDWASRSLAGIRGLLAFLSRFEGPYAKISLAVPLHVDLSLLFPEPRLLKHQLETCGQVRVLDMARALSCLNRPAWLVREARDLAGTQQNQSVRLQVHDDFLPENSGLYQLSLVDAQEPARRLPDPDGPWDLKISACLLATLLLGSQGLSDLAEHPEIRISPDLALERYDLLCRFLVRKKCGIYDFF